MARPRVSPKKFSKSEVKKFDCAIKHIDESEKEGGHDFWSALFCSGITFSDEVDRFANYALHLANRADLTEKILETRQGCQI